MPPQDPTTEPKIRRRRAKAPHSKNGCITCKIRHVKCDERHPYCKKCPAAGWTCDGYAPPPTKPKKPTPKTLVPKPKQVSSSVSTSRTIPNVLLQHNCFMDDQEYQYYRSFCDYTTARLTGFFDCNLWSRTVQQACESNPPIRHAATAIGALVFQGNPNADSQVELLRREFAYQAYSKAINLSHDLTHDGSQSIQTTLISCLIFASFELFNGYPETAALQIQSGIQLLTSLYSQDPVSRTSIKVEEDVETAFHQLQLQVAAYSDSNHCSYLENSGSGPGVLDGVPLFLAAIQDARIGLENLMTQTMNWVSRLQPNTKLLTVPGQTSITIDPLLELDITPQQRELLATFRHWEETFGYVWDLGHKADALHLFLGSAVSRLESLVNYLTQIAFGVDNRYYYSRYVVEVTEVLEWPKRLLNHTTYANRSAIGRSRSAPLYEDQGRTMVRSGSGSLTGTGANSSVGWFSDSEEDSLSDRSGLVPDDSAPRDVNWGFGGKAALQPLGGYPEEWDRRGDIISWF